MTAAELVALLTARGQTLGCAESLTGGLLTDAIVQVPGASRVLMGGIVAYDEGRKQTLLRQSPRIGFELDTNHRMRVESHSCTYSSVIGVGTVSFLTDPAEKAAGLRAILRHCIGRDDLPLTEAQLSAVCVFSLTVESLSCKESL